MLLRQDIQNFRTHQKANLPMLTSQYYTFFRAGTNFLFCVYSVPSPAWSLAMTRALILTFIALHILIKTRAFIILYLMLSPRATDLPFLYRSSGSVPLWYHHHWIQWRVLCSLGISVRKGSRLDNGVGRPGVQLPLPSSVKLRMGSNSVRAVLCGPLVNCGESSLNWGSCGS